MEYLESLFESVQSIDFSNSKFFLNIAIASAIVVLLGVIGRVFFGKKSELNHAVSSSIGILFLYILGMFLYGSNTRFSGLLTTLPFTAVRDNMLAIFSFQNANLQQICEMLLRMIMLAFFVNLLDTLLPRGKNIFTWLAFRLITVFLAVISQTLIVWISLSFLPASFLQQAPVVLLIILAAALLLGALKLFLGIALAAVNPVIGALYTFFFANLVGRQISKSVLTTAILSGFVLVLNQLGYVVISLAGISVAALLPIILVLLVVWYLVNALL